MNELPVSGLKSRIAALSPEKRALLEQRLRDQQRDALPQICHRDRGDVVPVSFAQRRLWFIEQFQPGTPLYNVARAMRIRGRLNRDALQAAFQTLVDRHEALRTTFETKDGEPVQRIHPSRPLPCPLVPWESGDTPLALQLTAEARKPFDLAKDLMLRITLFQLREDEHILLLVIHHLACDGWSLRILFDELTQLYRRYVEPSGDALQPATLQYADYAAWQREQLESASHQQNILWWQQKLAGAPFVSSLPTDHPRPSVQTRDGEIFPFDIPRTLLDQADFLARELGVTRYIVLLTTYFVLLYRWTGETDLVIGSAFSGRRREETHGIVGFFVDTVVVRGNLFGNPTVRELLKRVQCDFLEVIDHADIPFDRLVHALPLTQDLSRHPVFQVLFNAPPQYDLILKGLEVDPLPVDVGIARFDLEMTFSDGANRSTGFSYNRDLFDRSTIERMSQHYLQLLKALLFNPDHRLLELPMLPNRERQQVVVTWNQTESDYPREHCVHELFEQQAANTPDAIAVADGDRQWTYRQLNQDANQIAGLLRAYGVGPKQLVGVCLPRSYELISSILGVLKAGAGYLPLDVEQPTERLQFLIDDASLAVIVTDPGTKERLPAGSYQGLSLKNSKAKLQIQSVDNPPHTSGAEDIAYVMFTSGSTGAPKGVAVCHRSIVRLVIGNNNATFGPDRILVQLAPIAFDASTFEIWGALLHGGKLVVAPEGPPDFAGLERLLKTHQVTTLWLTASLFNQIIEQRPTALDDIQEILTGGEALSVKHIELAQQRLGPNVQLINGYGPTEGTTFTCCYKIPNPLPMGTTSIPIGRPIANTQVYILDDRHQPVPIGVYGELYIGGDGVAKEYLNRPELTAERFLPDPFGDSIDARLYRSGDYGRWRPDGTIEYLGRRDEQVKLRGFRIELGEIESLLISHPSVSHAVAIVREDQPGDKRLVAYVVPHADTEPDFPELARLFRSKLPAYMVPSAFLRLDSIPLTSSGKVNRIALPRPDGARAVVETEYVAPRNSMEERIAAVWREVLRLEKVGIHDNFFALGGHSLLAMVLLAKLEKELNWTPPLAVLFKHPTIAELVQYAETGTKTATASEVIVPIQSHGTLSPLWCLHCGYGFVHHYQRLSQLLGPDQPVFGVQPPGLDGSLPQPASVEAMAKRYTGEILRFQPTGPYRLCGYSFGGVAATEIAHQLTARGHEVELVALFDSHLPHKEPLALRFQRHLTSLSGLSMQAKADYLWEKITGNVRTHLETSKRNAEKAQKLAISREHVQKGLPVPIELQGPYFYAHCRRIWEEYRPARYPGRLVLFRQTERSWFYRDVPDLGWGSASDHLEIVDIPGGHGALLQEPQVKDVADRLRTLLKSKS